LSRKDANCLKLQEKALKLRGQGRTDKSEELLQEAVLAGVRINRRWTPAPAYDAVVRKAQEAAATVIGTSKAPKSWRKHLPPSSPRASSPVSTWSRQPASLGSDMARPSKRAARAAATASSSVPPMAGPQKPSEPSEPPFVPAPEAWDGAEHRPPQAQAARSSSPGRPPPGHSPVEPSPEESRESLPSPLGGDASPRVPDRPSAARPLAPPCAAPEAFIAPAVVGETGVVLGEAVVGEAVAPVAAAQSKQARSPCPPPAIRGLAGPLGRAKASTKRERRALLRARAVALDGHLRPSELTSHLDLVATCIAQNGDPTEGRDAAARVGADASPPSPDPRPLRLDAPGSAPHARDAPGGAAPARDAPGSGPHAPRAEPATSASPVPLVGELAGVPAATAGPLARAAPTPEPVVRDRGCAPVATTTDKAETSAEGAVRAEPLAVSVAARKEPSPREPLAVSVAARKEPSPRASTTRLHAEREDPLRAAIDGIVALVRGAALSSPAGQLPAAPSSPAGQLPAAPPLLVSGPACPAKAESIPLNLLPNSAAGGERPECTAGGTLASSRVPTLVKPGGSLAGERWGPALPGREGRLFPRNKASASPCDAAALVKKTSHDVTIVSASETTGPLPTGPLPRSAGLMAHARPMLLGGGTPLETPVAVGQRGAALSPVLIPAEHPRPQEVVLPSFLGDADEGRGQPDLRGLYPAACAGAWAGPPGAEPRAATVRHSERKLAVGAPMSTGTAPPPLEWALFRQGAIAGAVPCAPAPVPCDAALDRSFQSSRVGSKGAAAPLPTSCSGAAGGPPLDGLPDWYSRQPHASGGADMAPPAEAPADRLSHRPHASGGADSAPRAEAPAVTRAFALPRERTLRPVGGFTEALATGFTQGATAPAASVSPTPLFSVSASPPGHARSAPPGFPVRVESAAATPGRRVGTPCIGELGSPRLEPSDARPPSRRRQGVRHACAQRRTGVAGPPLSRWERGRLLRGSVSRPRLRFLLGAAPVGRDLPPAARPAAPVWRDLQEAPHPAAPSVDPYIGAITLLTQQVATLVSVVLKCSSCRCACANHEGAPAPSWASSPLPRQDLQEAALPHARDACV
jgi:hypothetical protein